MRASDILSTSSSRDTSAGHIRRGWSITQTSVCCTPMTSLAISGRPVLQNTVRTSGNSSSTFSIRVVIATESSRVALGRRTTSTSRSPSSSLGMNSAPSRIATGIVAATSAAAPNEIHTGCQTANRATGR